mgnify:CR=1 FL=1
MNILVHAFNISPNRGSEFSVSWNYVLQMSKLHHLYVLVGGTSHTIGDYSELENIYAAYKKLSGNNMPENQSKMKNPENRFFSAGVLLQEK